MITTPKLTHINYAFLNRCEGLDREQMKRRMDWTASESAFCNMVRRLRDKGLLEQEDGLYRVTDDGTDMLMDSGDFYDS